MSRISKEVKKAMVFELIKHSKLDVDRDLKYKELCLAGDAIYDYLMREYSQHINALPKDFFRHDNRFFLEGLGIKLGNGTKSGFRISSYKPMYRFDSSFASDMHKLDANHPLIIAYLQVKEKYDDAELKIKQATADAEAILSTVNTFKQLWKVWAESKNVLGKFENDGKPNYPLITQNSGGAEQPTS